MVHKKRSVNFLTMVGKLEASTVCLRESTRRVQLFGNHAAVDRVPRVAVEDLVLSEANKPKRHRSACEILHETTILCSIVHRIIHRDLKISNASNDVVLSCCLKPTHLSSHSLINNLIVCNKSCYCSIINRKLNNNE